MRRHLACCALLALAAATSLAQTPAISTEVFIEANRPAAPPAQPAAQPDAAKKAISAWKGRKTEANLLAVKPFAEAGDAAAMRTMMEGYLHLLKSPKDRTASAALQDPTKALIPLAAIWAARVYPVEGPKKDVIAALAPCVKGPSSRPEGRSFTWERISSVANGIDCGVDMEGEAWNVKSIKDYAAGGKGSPKPDVWFVERAVVNAAEVDSARARQLIGTSAEYGVARLAPDDLAWLQAYVAARPEVQKEWDQARFLRDLRRVFSGGQPLDYAFYEAYKAGPGAAQYAEWANSQRMDRELASANFGANLSKAGMLHELESLRDTALREGGQKAADLWAKLRTADRIDRPDIHRFCEAGAQQACDDAQFLAGVDARAAERERAAQAAGLASGASELTSAEDMTKALADRLEQVNRENCARADLGASIACTRD